MPQSRMLELTKVADLDVSAASGLVALGDRLCVVADDELFLALYDLEGRPEQRVALFPGALSETHAERKRDKRDLEALAALPDGRLLALGSGSTEGRMRGALIEPARGWTVHEIDLRPLYGALRTNVPELNIEGAAVHAGRLWLAQRGNGASGANACIELDLESVAGSLDRENALRPNSLCALHTVQLGELDGVPLGLTDLAADPRTGLLFCAAAETGASTYEDGACAGSVIGRLSIDGEVQTIVRV